LGKVALWDTVFYYVAQFVGSVVGVALASFILHGASANKAVHYAATIPAFTALRVRFWLNSSFRLLDERDPVRVQSRE